MHNINNTNNAQFDDKNPPASPKVFAFGFFAENRYICTVMQGDTAEMQAKRAVPNRVQKNFCRFPAHDLEDNALISIVLLQTFQAFQS